MSDQNSDDFKFGLDQENPDDVLQVSTEDSRIAKLSRRITVLAVIIPCLIGVALFFLYLDLKGRVIQNQTSGNQSFEVLSQDLAGQIQEISAKLTQMESGVSEKSATAEKRIEDLKNQIGKLESSLKKTDSNLKKFDTAKADKKEQESLADKLAVLSTQLGARNAEWDDKMAELSTDSGKLEAEIVKFRQDIGQFREDIGDFNTLVETKIDRRTLLLEIDKQQQKITVLSGDIEKKLIAIRSELRRLDKDLQQARQALRSLAAAATSSSASEGQRQPDTDKIIEQNLE